MSCVSVIQCFLLLGSIPYYGCMPVGSFNSFTTWCCFSIGWLWIVLFYTYACRFSYAHVFFFLLSTSLRVVLMGCTLNIKVSSCIISQSGCAILHSHQKWMSFCWFTALPEFDVVSVLSFGYSHRCIVVSHNCCNLYFPDDIWFRASVHMLMYVFFN